MAVSTILLFTGWPILGSTSIGLSASSSSNTQTLTNVGRELIARSIVEGLSFEILEVAYGSGGYSPSDPTNALPAFATATSLDSEVYREPLTLINRLEGGITECYYRLDKDEINGQKIGEIGLYAQITRSPHVPAEVGTWVLYALVHTPLQVKGRNRVLTGKVTLTF